MSIDRLRDYSTETLRFLATVLKDLAHMANLQRVPLDPDWDLLIAMGPEARQRLHDDLCAVEGMKAEPLGNDENCWPHTEESVVMWVRQMILDEISAREAMRDQRS